MEEDKLINAISWALENNYDIILIATDEIDYNEQRLIWQNKNKYYIKNLKIEFILKEIKLYMNDNKKYFIKILFNDLKNNIEFFLINTPWEIIDKNKIDIMI
ncbi:hypothetical protein CPAV1605_572 [seawater metagenome]|uniref:Uncharacterized protein n=1 Tax=seawater metagenome TaxID=1561972 RepID=A0A5E8CIE7_9ZZZZ